MPLPGINIEFTNGNLGQVVEVPDGVFGLVASATAVTDTFALGTPYQIRGMQDVAALGITPSVDNYRLYKTLKEFYQEAGEGTELWLIGFARTTKPSEWFTPDGTGKAPAETLLDAANGKLKMLFTSFYPSAAYEVTLENGLDADVWDTLLAAQTLADNYTSSKYAPFYTLVEGYAFDGNKVTLDDVLEMSYNRCQVLIGDTEKRTSTPGSFGAAVGLLAGRKAKSQVQVNPGKVMDGPIAALELFVLDTPAEQYDVTALHDKGYVTFRTHVGKSGYYITDDHLACEISDDYHYGTHRRVIDKAYRLAYQALLDFLLDDNVLNQNGTIDSVYVKTIENRVESLIYTQMTANGELSSDPNNSRDRGVVCKVDLTHNVASTSKLKVSQLQVKPKGHNRWIDVPLGFVTITNE